MILNKNHAGIDPFRKTVSASNNENRNSDQKYDR